jgi:RND family efflux transporter MFP subunit
MSSYSIARLVLKVTLMVRRWQMHRARQNVAASRLGVRPGSTTILGVMALVAILLVTGSGLWWWAKHRGASNDSSVLLHTVNRDDFELTVTERGEVESFDLIEVRSMVKAKNTTGTAILRIVPEGTVVKEGDFLVELDSSALEADRLTQQIAVNTAQALVVEARNIYETAVIAKREYLEGTFIQEHQTIESTVFVAEENLNRAKEYYTYSQKLASKGYVNELQLEADRFAVEKAQKELDAANTNLMVLEEFTKEKMVKQFESDIKISEAKLESAKSSYQLEMDKLREIQDQIAKCTLVAPQSGTVKYAHVANGRGDQEVIIEEGAIVRERQAVIYLPNADSMRVALTINESLIQYVRPGMRTTISPVGSGDKVLRGKVTKVNQYAEPTGWRQANVKEYKAFVSIDEPTTDLRSGMTAAVTIHCAEEHDALQVPVQSIFSHGDKFYCFLYDDGMWEARQIKPGPTNDKFFVVESGLDAGDRVALNPRRFIAEVKLPKLLPEQVQRAVPQVVSDETQAEEGVQGGLSLPPSPPGQQRPGVRPSPPGQGGKNTSQETAARPPAATSASGEGSAS